MAAGRRALVVATYTYADGGLSKLAAPAHDAESFAAVLEDPAIAGFDVTMLVNKAHYEVGEAIAVVGEKFIFAFKILLDGS